MHYAIGLEHLNGGDMSLALTKFKELTENHPDYVPTYYQYAMAQVQSGQIDEAIGTIEKGIPIAATAGERKTVNELQALLEDLECQREHESEAAKAFAGETEMSRDCYRESRGQSEEEI